MATGRRPTRFRSQRAVALLETALCAPLFLAVIYGIWVIGNLARAQHQVAMVAHAVTRVAASGVTDGYVLSRVARDYARSMGMSERTSLVVEVDRTSLGIRERDRRRRATINPGTFSIRRMVVSSLAESSFGSMGGVSPVGILGALGSAMSNAIRVRVSGIVPVGGPLKRMWPDGVPVRCSSVCLANTWKSPFALLKDLIRIPEF